MATRLRFTAPNLCSARLRVLYACRPLDERTVSVVAASSHARRAEVGGLRITDVAYRAGFDTSRHVHEHDCVTLALRGQVAKELNTSERTLAGGAVAVTPAEMPHVDRFGPDGGRVLVIELLERPEALSGDTPRTEALRLPWLGAGSPPSSRRRTRPRRSRCTPPRSSCSRSSAARRRDPSREPGWTTSSSTCTPTGSSA